MSIGLGQLTPEIVAKRCEARGARVIERNGRYMVYPPDRSHRPLGFSAVKMQGRHAQNLVKDLARIGLDIMADTPADQPLTVKKADPVRKSETDPKPMTHTMQAAVAAAIEKEPPVVAPTEPTTNGKAPLSYTQEPRSVPFDYRKGYADLRELVATLAKRLDDSETTTLAMLTEQGAKLSEMDARLETVAPKPKPKPPSISEVCRREVLAFLETTAPLKWSPSAVEGNIADRLPPGRAKTSVALALQNLAERKLIKGGARGISPTMGLYWAEKVPATTS